VWDKSSKQDGLSGQSPFVRGVWARSAAASVPKIPQKAKSPKDQYFRGFWRAPFLQKLNREPLEGQLPPKCH